MSKSCKSKTGRRVSKSGVRKIEKYLQMKTRSRHSNPNGWNFPPPES